MYSRSITKYFVLEFIYYITYTVDYPCFSRRTTDFCTTFRCVQTYKPPIDKPWTLALHTHTMMTTGIHIPLSERLVACDPSRLWASKYPKVPPTSVGRNSISFEVSTNQNFSSDSTDTIIIPSAQYDSCSDLDAQHQIANSTREPGNFLSFIRSHKRRFQNSTLHYHFSIQLLYIRFLSTTDSVKYTRPTTMFRWK
jgi:hypothetical protein